MAKTPTPAPAEPGPGHNLSPTELRERRAAQRLAQIQTIREARDARVEAQNTVKAMRKIETRLRNDYGSSGYSLAILDEALEREETPNRALLKYEQERFEVFEDLGQQTYVQPGLFDRMPKAKQDEEFWSNHGYQTGIAGKPAALPDELPTEFTQLWLRRHTAGRERMAWAVSEAGVNPDRDTLTGTGVSKPEINDGEEEDEEDHNDSTTIKDPLLN